MTSLMFCCDRYKAWNTRSLGKNSGTASRPPLHPISLTVEVEQVHVSAVLFERRRTGHESGILGRRVAVVPIALRLTEQTKITENSTWTNDAQTRRSRRTIICRIIRTFLVLLWKQVSRRRRLFHRGQIECPSNERIAVASCRYVAVLRVVLHTGDFLDSRL